MKKLLLTLLVLVLALGFLVACDDQSEPPSGNVPCTHSFGEWTTVTPAKCTESGMEMRTCTACGQEEERALVALGHDEENHEAQAPTCLEKGGDAYVTCSRCDYTTYNEKSALGHNEKNHSEKTPTCLDSGWDAYVTCSRCDYTSYVEKSALGHQWEEEWQYNGAEHYHECGRTGCEAVKDNSIHSYDGELDADCNICGSIRATHCSHPSTQMVTGYAATCTAPGKTDGLKCTACGDMITPQQTISPLGHDDVNHNANPPSCLEKGWDAYVTCRRDGCGYTTYAEKAALGHDEESHDAKAPTCLAIGWDAYVICSRCDYTTYAEKAALGHDEESHDAKAPTCLAIGWDAYVTCSRCDYTTYAEKAALGHDEENHDAKAPTCLEKGWDAYVTCSRCDYTTYAEKAASGHTVVTDKAVAPSCSQTGLTEGSHCFVCNTVIIKQETIGKTEHNIKDNWCSHCYYPYTTISTEQELKNISMNGKYVLISDIDLGGAEWKPIGTSNTYCFTGVFDGNGHKVYNFKITEPSNYIGFFGYSNSSTIQNLILYNFSINVSATDGTTIYAGGLLGIHRNGVLENCYASGTIQVSGYDCNYVGGLVGRVFENETVLDCSASVNISITESGKECIAGGLIGDVRNYLVLSNSSASGKISVVGFSSKKEHSFCYAGGFVGYNNGGYYENCYASGDVTSTANSSNQTKDSYSYAGGFIGYNNRSTIKDNDAYIFNCYATGDILSASIGTVLGGDYDMIDSHSHAGGLVGYNNGGKISNCHSTGKVTASSSSSTSSFSHSYAGGLVGYNYKSEGIHNSYAIGGVIATSTSKTEFSYGSYAGGLVGYHTGIAGVSNGYIWNCYAEGFITCESTCGGYGGGLVGYSNDGIINSYALGNVFVNAHVACAGGLTGANYSDIANCFATGNVVLSTDNLFANAGAIVGQNDNNARIMNCYYCEKQSFSIDIKDRQYTEPTNSYGQSQSLETIKNISFYKNTLAWDETIWLLSDGTYPNLN